MTTTGSAGLTVSSSGNVTIAAPSTGATLTIAGAGGSGGSGNWTIYNPFDLNPPYWGEHYERAEDLLFRLTKMANQLEGLPEEDLQLVEEAKQLVTDLIVAKKEYADAKRLYEENMAAAQQAQNYQTYANQYNTYVAQQNGLANAVAGQSGTYQTGWQDPTKGGLRTVIAEEQEAKVAAALQAELELKRQQKERTMADLIEQLRAWVTHRRMARFMGWRTGWQRVRGW